MALRQKDPNRSITKPVNSKPTIRHRNTYSNLALGPPPLRSAPFNLMRTENSSKLQLQNARHSKRRRNHSPQAHDSSNSSSDGDESNQYTRQRGSRSMPMFDRYVRPAMTLRRRATIDKLSNECLYRVFQYLADPEALTTVSRVCRRWRFITTDPWMWRTLEHDWIEFLESMYFFKHMPNHYALGQVKHARTLRITARREHFCKVIPMCVPRVYPYTQLTRLELARMYLHDIIGLTKWLSHIEELLCTAVLSQDMAQNNVLSSFTGLRRLRVLHLHFYDPCNHGNYAFMISPNRRRPGLPPTLTDLQVTNLHDSEEQLLHDLRPHHWTRIEAAMMLKYSPLQALTGLHTLVLHRCSAFTARIWRECLTPCAARLRHLSLSSIRTLNYDAELLRPQHDRALPWSTDEESPVRDADRAIYDFFICLASIETLHLEDFIMSPGVVRGLRALEPDRGQSVWVAGATIHGKNDCPVDEIEDLLEHPLAYCDLVFR